jgi:hypothetical protein
VPDHRDAEVDGVTDGALDDLALGRADRADVLAAFDPERADDAAVGCFDETSDGFSFGSEDAGSLPSMQQSAVPSSPPVAQTSVS